MVGRAYGYLFYSVMLWVVRQPGEDPRPGTRAAGLVATLFCFNALTTALLLEASGVPTPVFHGKSPRTTTMVFFLLVWLFHYLALARGGRAEAIACEFEQQRPIGSPHASRFVAGYVIGTIAFMFAVSFWYAGWRSTG